MSSLSSSSPSGSNFTFCQVAVAVRYREKLLMTLRFQACVIEN